MLYSKLVKFRLKHYTQFVDTTIDFTDMENIHVFKGLNGNGKSNVLAGLNELFSYVNSPKDKNNIQYGREESLLQATFSDGVMIEKKRRRAGQTAYTMYKDNEVVFTTISGKEWTPVSYMPEPIEKYLNLPRSEKVNLLQRVQRDKLLLLDTTGGENYEFLSSSLNNKELHVALSLINKDHTALRKSVIELQNEYLAYLKVIKGQRELDKGVITSLRTLDTEIDKVLGCLQTLHKIYLLADNFDGLVSTSNYVVMEEIDTVKFESLSRLLGAIGTYNELVAVSEGVHLPELAVEDVERLQKLEGIFGAEASLLAEYNKALSKTDGLSTSELLRNWFEASCLVDCDTRLSSLQVLSNSVTTLQELKEKENQLVVTTNRLQEWLSQAYGILEKQGYTIYTCEDCGSMSLQPCGHGEG